MASSLFPTNQSNNINIDPKQIEMVKQFLSGKNMSAEQAVRMICRQRGIDVEAFMKNLQIPNK